MPDTPPTADDIQREMRHVRTELRADVQEVVESARGLGEWSAYVRSYPWFCLGAAAAVGYLLVPSRMTILRPDTASLLELARQNKLVVQMNQTAQKPSLVRGLMGMAAGSLAQAGMALVTQQLNQFLAAHDGAPPRPREGDFS